VVRHLAVDNILWSDRVEYLSIPAAAFTHPEISYVGMTEQAAKDLGKAEGFEVGAVRSYFKGNSKAIAEDGSRVECEWLSPKILAVLRSTS